MKSIFFALSLAFLVALMPAESSAQQRMAPQLDSIVNVDTADFAVTIGDFAYANFEVNMAKVSGTVAGTAVLQGAISGNAWYTITDANSQGSVSLTNADNNIRWVLEGRSYVKYRIRVIGSGTSKSYVRAYVYVQKE